MSFDGWPEQPSKREMSWTSFTEWLRSKKEENHGEPAGQRLKAIEADDVDAETR